MPNKQFGLLIIATIGTIFVIPYVRSKAVEFDTDIVGLDQTKYLHNLYNSSYILATQLQMQLSTYVG